MQFIYYILNDFFIHHYWRTQHFDSSEKMHCLKYIFICFFLTSFLVSILLGFYLLPRIQFKINVNLNIYSILLYPFSSLEHLEMNTKEHILAHIKTAWIKPEQARDLQELCLIIGAWSWKSTCFIRLKTIHTN